jgi:integrase
MPTGFIFKKCGCPDPETGRPLYGRCPRIRMAKGQWNPGHGRWAYRIPLPPATPGKARPLIRHGLASQDEAQRDLDHVRYLLSLAGRDHDTRIEVADIIKQVTGRGRRLPDAAEVRRRMVRNTLPGCPFTVAEYLTEWFTEKAKLGTIRESTAILYDLHIRVHLTPHLGHIQLADLQARHVKAMFIAIIDRNRAIETARASTDPQERASVHGCRITGPATRDKIRATLRNSLNDAIADDLILKNAAVRVATPYVRPVPIMWTAERVARWRDIGEVPGSVMVWTAEQTCAFLDYAEVHAPDLFPMLHFAAYRGARRGEVCGLLEAEVRIDNRSARITNQITPGRRGPSQNTPKSAAGKRDVYYDDGTQAVLTAYRDTKTAQRQTAGAAWPDTGLFFVRPDGRPWNPANVSVRFKRLAAAAGLPPIRLHDLRHVAATVSLDGGVDIRVLQEQLGHSTSALTRDTYQSVSEELHRAGAEAVAQAMKRRAA